jgi:hypothetical protein
MNATQTIIESQTMVRQDPTNPEGGHIRTLALPEGSYNFSIVQENGIPITLFRGHKCVDHDGIAFYPMKVGEECMFDVREETEGKRSSSVDSVEVKNKLQEMGKRYRGIVPDDEEEEINIIEVLERVERILEGTMQPQEHGVPPLDLTSAGRTETCDESVTTMDMLGDAPSLDDILLRISQLGEKHLGQTRRRGPLDVINGIERRLEQYGNCHSHLISTFNHLFRVF